MLRVSDVQSEPVRQEWRRQRHHLLQVERDPAECHRELRCPAPETGHGRGPRRPALLLELETAAFDREQAPGSVECPDVADVEPDGPKSVSLEEAAGDLETRAGQHERERECAVRTRRAVQADAETPADPGCRDPRGREGPRDVHEAGQVGVQTAAGRGLREVDQEHQSASGERSVGLDRRAVQIQRSVRLDQILHPGAQAQRRKRPPVERETGAELHPGGPVEGGKIQGEGRILDRGRAALRAILCAHPDAAEADPRVRPVERQRGGPRRRLPRRQPGEKDFQVGPAVRVADHLDVEPVEGQVEVERAPDESEQIDVHGEPPERDERRRGELGSVGDLEPLEEEVAGPGETQGPEAHGAPDGFRRQPLDLSPDPPRGDDSRQRGHEQHRQHEDREQDPCHPREPHPPRSRTGRLPHVRRTKRPVRARGQGSAAVLRW